MAGTLNGTDHAPADSCAAGRGPALAAADWLSAGTGQGAAARYQAALGPVGPGPGPGLTRGRRALAAAFPSSGLSPGRSVDGHSPGGRGRRECWLRKGERRGRRSLGGKAFRGRRSLACSLVGHGGQSLPAVPGRFPAPPTRPHESRPPGPPLLTHPTGRSSQRGRGGGGRTAFLPNRTASVWAPKHTLPTPRRPRRAGPRPQHSPPVTRSPSFPSTLQRGRRRRKFKLEGARSEEASRCGSRRGLAPPGGGGGGCSDAAGRAGGVGGRRGRGL